MQQSQLIWQRPILLFLTIWLSNTWSVPFIYLPVQLTKWGLNSIDVLSSSQAGWDLCLLAPHVIAIVYHTNNAMPFAITAFLEL